MSSERDRLSEKDYYLANPPRQPKLEIGAYVESMGLLVPRRFVTLDEARKSDAPFIIRFEHPQDYNGISGLGESLVVTKEKIINATEACNGDLAIDWLEYNKVPFRNLVTVLEKILAGIPSVSQEMLELDLKRFSFSNLQEYSKFLKIDYDALLSEISFSYWEYIKGPNQIVVADSAIPDRYHVTTVKREYTIYEDGARIFSDPYFSQSDYAVFDRQAYDIFEFYERVRDLDRFDTNNVPIIETVKAEGKRYFLQLHRTRDFKPAGFSLERAPIGDEVEVELVRGVTPKEGTTVKTRIWYTDEIQTLEKGGSAFDKDYNHVFGELMAQRRVVQFIFGTDLLNHANDLTNGHLQRSRLFKPEISLVIFDKQMATLFPEADRLNVRDLKKFNPKLHVVSDGRRALVRRVL